VRFAHGLFLLRAGGAYRVRSKNKKFDCLDRLASGEPYFVLRAQDRLAPELIEAWAVEAELNDCPPEKVASAREVAKAMRGWRKRKMPD
jgi:hypothetical protein